MSIPETPASKSSEILRNFSGPSHMNCQLKRDNIARAMVIARKSIEGLKNSMVDVYRTEGPAHGGAGALSISKDQMVSFLATPGKIESVLSHLSMDGLGKVEKLFQTLVFEQCNPALLISEARALLDSLPSEKLDELKSLLFKEGDLEGVASSDIPLAVAKAFIKPETRRKYETFYATLDGPTKAKIQLKKTQYTLKPIDTLSPAHADVIRAKSFPKSHLHPDTILQSARTLPISGLVTLRSAFGNPITRTSEGTTLETPRALGQNPSETAWLIMGSNDLIQVERAFQKWAALPAEKRPRVLVFSGYGGHGTVHGPIFAHSEATSMSRYFEELAKARGMESELGSTKIIRETDSTNSGQNAQFIKESLDTHAGHPTIKHFVVFGVAPAVTRQVLTVEQNFKLLGYPFETISGYPPTHAEVASTYLADDKGGLKGLAAPIYQLCALREAASFYDYAIGTDFMAPWSPTAIEVEKSIDVMNQSMETLFPGSKSDKIPHIADSKLFAKNFCRLMELKAMPSRPPALDAELNTLKTALLPLMKPFSAYLRQAFANVEEAHMEKLSVDLSLEEQTALLKTNIRSFKETTKASVGIGQELADRVVSDVADWLLEHPDTLSAEHPREKTALITYLTDQTIAKGNIRPRVELRKVSDKTFQVAIAFKNAEARTEALPTFSKLLHGKCSLVVAGTTTLECGEIGIDKSSPMKLMSYPALTHKMLSAMHYTPGPVINAFEQGIVVSDADGTIWNTAKTGESHETVHLGNSPVLDDLVEYLLIGGILVLNSGNDVDRTIERLRQGFRLFTSETQAILYSRVAICGMGGHVFKLLSEKGSRDFADYPSYSQVPSCDTKSETSMAYLGDDPKIDGNDMPGFLHRGLDRCLCVPAPTTKIPDKGMPHSRIIPGGPATTALFFKTITSTAREAHTARKSPRLFDDFDTICAKMQKGKDS